VLNWVRVHYSSRARLSVAPGFFSQPKVGNVRIRSALSSHTPPTPRRKPGERMDVHREPIAWIQTISAENVRRCRAADNLLGSHNRRSMERGGTCESPLRHRNRGRPSHPFDPLAKAAARAPQCTPAIASAVSSESVPVF
jgi:hypothetical protein